MKFVENNSMKFPKPRIVTPNNFETKPTTKMETIKRLANKLDGTYNCPEYQEFMDTAYEDVRGLKAAKLKKKNNKQQKRREVQQREFENNLPCTDYSTINNINTETLNAGELPIVEISINDKKIPALLDTGSTNSLLNVDIAQEIKLSYTGTNKTISTSNGTSDTNCIGETQNTQIQIQGLENDTVSLGLNFLICRYINGFPALLGTDIIFNPELESKIEQLNWDMTDTSKNKRIRIPLSLTCNGEVPAKQKKKVRFRTPENKTLISHVTVMTTTTTTEGADREDDRTTDSKTKVVEEYLKNPDKLDRNHRLHFSDQLPEEKAEEVPEFFAENDLPEASSTTIAEFDENTEFKIKYYKIEDINLNHLPGKYQGKFHKLINSYPSLFSKSEYDIGFAKDELIDIEMMNIPPSQSQRFLDYKKLDFAKRTINELEKAGVVQLEKDPLVVQNLVLVPKYKSADKSNSKAEKLYHQIQKSKIRAYRLCLDLRLVNSQTTNVSRTKSVNIDDFIAQLKGQIVTSFDLTQAYFTLPLTRRAQRLTAFYVGKNIYSFKRLSMGLISACENFHQFMTRITNDTVYAEIFGNLTEQEKALAPKSFKNFFSHYFDDVFIFSKDLDTHFVCVKMVMLAFLKAGLKVAPSKSRIAVTTFPILGVTLDTLNDVTQIDQIRIQAIQNWTRPSSLYEVHSRIAMLAYFSKYLPGLKTIIYPLIHLLRTKEFVWGKIQEDSWVEIKQLAELAIQLYIPQKSDQLFLFTDSSKLAASQILMTIKGNDLRIIAVNSRTFASADLGKSSYTKESISLVMGIKNFAHYLFASEKPAKIFTDCKSLVFVGQKSFYKLAEYNISAFLSYYAKLLNFELHHIPGQFNLFADLFSRQIANNKSYAKTIVQSHFKSQTLPKYFKIDSDTFFSFLTSPPKDFLTNKTEKPSKVLSPAQLIQLYQGNFPEVKWVTTKMLQNAKLNEDIERRNTALINRQIEKDKVAKINNNFTQKSPLETTQTVPLDITDDLNNVPNKINTFIEDLILFQHGALLNMIDKTKFSELQKHDFEINKLHKAPTDDFEIIDEIVYRKTKDKRLLYIPTYLAKNVLELIHRKLSHASFEKTKCYWTNYYFHPKIDVFLKTIIYSCIVCNIVPTTKSIKYINGQTRSFMAERPRQGISIDLITNLPSNKFELTCIVLIHDLFSRYINIYFSKNKTQLEIRKALLAYFANNGPPLFVQCDTDSTLITVIKELGQLYKFHFETTTPYGQHQNRVERSFQDIKKLIQKVIYDPSLLKTPNRSLWPFATILAINAYNALSIRGIHYSREQIQFRYANENILYLNHNDLPNGEDIDEKILQDVKKYMNRERNNMDGKQPDFKEHEIIYLKRPKSTTPGMNTAFLDTKLGPFSIIDISKDGLEYRLKELQTGKMFFSHPKFMQRIQNPAELVTILYDLDWDKNLSKMPRQIKNANDTNEPKNTEL